MRTSFLVVTGLLVAMTLQAQKLPKIKAPKVGNPLKTAERTLDASVEGDTKTLHKIVEHTTAYAVEHYKITDLVTKKDVERANDEMYAFLKWKMGSPTAAAAQYTTAGYSHFEKAYGDEATAALLGFELPREKGGHAEFIIPPVLIQLRLVVAKATNQLAAKALQDTYGIPAFISVMVLNALAEQEANSLKRLGINLPHDYDFPNGLLQLTIEARRDPQGTRAKLQKVIDQKVAKKG
jgi:hypothetical protein